MIRYRRLFGGFFLFFFFVSVLMIDFISYVELIFTGLFAFPLVYFLFFFPLLFRFNSSVQYSLYFSGWLCFHVCSWLDLDLVWFGLVWFDMMSFDSSMDDGCLGHLVHFTYIRNQWDVPSASYSKTYAFIFQP